MQDNEDRIREHAHKLWESEGKPEGRDKEHWQQAERVLSSAAAGENRTPDKRIGQVEQAEEQTAESKPGKKAGK